MEFGEKTETRIPWNTGTDGYRGWDQGIVRDGDRTHIVNLRDVIVTASAVESCISGCENGVIAPISETFRLRILQVTDGSDSFFILEKDEGSTWGS